MESKTDYNKFFTTGPIVTLNSEKLKDYTNENKEMVEEIKNGIFDHIKNNYKEEQRELIRNVETAIGEVVSMMPIPGQKKSPNELGVFNFFKSGLAKLGYGISKIRDLTVWLVKTPIRGIANLIKDFTHSEHITPENAPFFLTEYGICLIDALQTVRDNGVGVKTVEYHEYAEKILRGKERELEWIAEFTSGKKEGGIDDSTKKEFKKMYENTPDELAHEELLPFWLRKEKIVYMQGEINKVSDSEKEGLQNLLDTLVIDSIVSYNRGSASIKDYFSNEKIHKQFIDKLKEYEKNDSLTQKGKELLSVYNNAGVGAFVINLQEYPKEMQPALRIFLTSREKVNDTTISIKEVNGHPNYLAVSYTGTLI